MFSLAVTVLFETLAWYAVKINDVQDFAFYESFFSHCVLAQVVIIKQYIFNSCTLTDAHQMCTAIGCMCLLACNTFAILKLNQHVMMLM